MTTNDTAQFVYSPIRCILETGASCYTGGILDIDHPAGKVFPAPYGGAFALHNEL